MLVRAQTSAYISFPPFLHAQPGERRGAPHTSRDAVQRQGGQQWIGPLASNGSESSASSAAHLCRGQGLTSANLVRVLQWRKVVVGGGARLGGGLMPLVVACTCVCCVGAVRNIAEAPARSPSPTRNNSRATDAVQRPTTTTMTTTTTNKCRVDPCGGPVMKYA